MNGFAKLDSSSIKQISSASNDKMSVKVVGNFSCVKNNEVYLNNVSVVQIVKNGTKVIFDKGKIFNRTACIAEVKWCLSPSGATGTSNNSNDEQYGCFDVAS